MRLTGRMVSNRIRGYRAGFSSGSVEHPEAVDGIPWSQFVKAKNIAYGEVYMKKSKAKTDDGCSHLYVVNSRIKGNEFSRVGTYAESVVTINRARGMRILQLLGFVDNDGSITFEVDLDSDNAFDNIVAAALSYEKQKEGT